jgi:hypothetical protein
MATKLGKRKRELKTPGERADLRNSEDSSSSELDAQEIFRRHFEAQFKPLPVVPKKTVEVEPQEDDDSGPDSEWSGISEAEDGLVEVIEHTDAESRMAAMSKEELKAFMASTNLRPMFDDC